MKIRYLHPGNSNNWTSGKSYFNPLRFGLPCKKKKIRLNLVITKEISESTKFIKETLANRATAQEKKQKGIQQKIYMLGFNEQ